VSRRDDIKSLFTIEPTHQQLAAANARSPAAHSIGRVAAGPVRSMGLALDKLEEESRALHDALAKGATIVELDPGVIDPSFVKDRLSGVVDEDFDALKKIDRGAWSRDANSCQASSGCRRSLSNCLWPPTIASGGCAWA